MIIGIRTIIIYSFDRQQQQLTGMTENRVRGKCPENHRIISHQQQPTTANDRHKQTNAAK